MDRAIVVCCSDEENVTAEKYISEGYYCLPDYERQTYCPMCHQPVSFCQGQFQPHFRHKPNNPVAQWCELYSRNKGCYGAQYERIPPPLFIRRRRGSEDVFVIEIGLKRVKDSVLACLEAEGAALIVSDARPRSMKYAVNKERFSCGEFRIPLVLKRGYSAVQIRLANTNKKFKDVWGALSPIGDEVVFLCDRDSLSGRRVESWGCVAYDDSLLIVSASSLEKLRVSFPDIVRIGSCDLVTSKDALNVYLATVGNEASGFLERHQLGVRQLDDTPEILWPPSLTSMGEIIPLFEKSNCAFKVRASNDEKGCLRTRLYTHCRSDVRQSSARAMERTRDVHWMLASVPQLSDIRFLSTRDWIFSNVILLGFRGSELDLRLNRAEWAPRVEESGLGTYTIEAQCTTEIRILRRGGAADSFVIGPGEAKRLSLKQNALLRAYSRIVLNCLHGRRLLFELASGMAYRKEQNLQTTGLKRVIGAPALGCDRCFVELRSTLQRGVARTSDIGFAMARKGSR